MIFSRLSAALATGLAASSVAFAAPVDSPAQLNASDIDILNIALTLEHLEVAFYTQGLNKFNATDFTDAGLPEFARGRFEEILQNEQTHVDTLSLALGPNATNPCLYNFPFTDAKGFAELSAILETIGASAYTGAAAMLSDAALITEAASILATEARQAAWVKSAVMEQNPWSTPFETPLTLRQAFSLASILIEVCPYSNPVLPVSEFHSLTVTTLASKLHAGHNISVDFWPPFDLPDTSDNSTSSNSSDSSSSSQYYLAFMNGMEQYFEPLRPLNSSEVASYLTYQWAADVPAQLKGTVFVVVTSDNTTVTDDNTIAGVAVIDFAFNSNGTAEEY